MVGLTPPIFWGVQTLPTHWYQELTPTPYFYFKLKKISSRSYLPSLFFNFQKITCNKLNQRTPHSTCMYRKVSAPSLLLIFFLLVNRRLIECQYTLRECILEHYICTVHVCCTLYLLCCLNFYILRSFNNNNIYCILTFISIVYVCIILVIYCNNVKFAGHLPRTVLHTRNVFGIKCIKNAPTHLFYLKGERKDQDTLIDMHSYFI